MSKSLFVSYVHEDKNRLLNILKWENKKLLGDVVVTHETEDKRFEGKEAIKLHLKRKIQGAAAVLVLIGQDTHNHDWIRAEVELANSYHVKVFCVRLPGDKGASSTGAVPPILTNCPVITFDPSKIKKLIEEA